MKTDVPMQNTLATMKPAKVVVSEIQNKEAAELLAALATGHACGVVSVAAAGCIPDDLMGKFKIEK